MIENNSAIVLKSIKFRESSHILNTYTKEHGKLSFILHGTGSKKKAKIQSLLQPLTILDISFNYKAANNLQNIKEIKCLYPYRNIPFDVRRSSIALFLSEILTKCLQEEEQNEILYQFLKSSLTSFDSGNVNVNLFHLIFLFKLTKFFGFYPNNNQASSKKYFHLHKGEFVSEYSSSNCMNDECSSYINYLFTIGMEDWEVENISRKAKTELLDYLLKYYSIHYYNLNNIKSLSILHELFD